MVTPENIKYACLGISLFGLLIRILSVGYSANHTSGRNTSAGQIAATINSTGLYSICRHPLYVGNFFMWLGIACLTQNLWFIVAFILMYWLYYERIMYAEEYFLIDSYGTSYTDWSNVTPAFIPKISRWKSNKLSFSWTKIIRQEKTGILNLFLVFFIFECIGNYIQTGTFQFTISFWFLGLLTAIVWYIVIKFLQKKTSVLKIDR